MRLHRPSTISHANDRLGGEFGTSYLPCLGLYPLSKVVPVFPSVESLSGLCRTWELEKYNIPSFLFHPNPTSCAKYAIRIVTCCRTLSSSTLHPVILVRVHPVILVRVRSVRGPHRPSGRWGAVAAWISAFGSRGWKDFPVWSPPTGKSAILLVGQRRPAPRARWCLSSDPPFPVDPACDQATFTTFVVRTDTGATLHSFATLHWRKYYMTKYDTYFRD